MQARSNGTKRPAMLDNEADGSKTVSVAVWSGLGVRGRHCVPCGIPLGPVT